MYTPTTDREIFVAKLLGPWLAAILISLVSFVLYMVMVDLSGWIVMKEILFPNLMWIALILWVSPAVAGLSLIAMVFVSARAQGFQDAYQSGGLVVLPVLAMVAGQFTGVLFFTVWVVLILGLVFWILFAILLWLASKGFTREQLMQKKRTIKIYSDNDVCNDISMKMYCRSGILRSSNLNHRSVEVSYESCVFLINLQLYWPNDRFLLVFQTWIEFLPR